MEVRTVDETTVSLVAVAQYVALATVIVGALFVPTVFVPGYGQLLNSVLLVVLLVIGARELLSAVFAFSSLDAPTAPADDDLPTVSVVIPAYNEAPVLPDTLAATRALDYPADKLEVLVCYEADSTDGTAAIAERAARDDDRIRAIERDEPGGGKARATNYALKFASGEIIASIDADHRFEPGAVRRAVAWFEDDESIGCVKGRCYGTNPTDSVLSLHATVERHVAEKGNIFAREVADGFTYFGGGQAFFRASVFERLGPFDEEILVEDIDMSARLHEAGVGLKVDPEVVTYEEHPVTFEAWWNQRKRWARGWMQVAVRHFPRVIGGGRATRRQRLDGAFTFAAAVVPALFVFSVPIVGVDMLSAIDTATFLPKGELLWPIVGSVPVVTAYMVFVQDYLDGRSHHWAEYLAAFTLGPYFMLQTAIYVAAFIDEFVLDRPAVYVTTARSERSNG